MGLTMKAGATFLKSPTLLDDYLPAKVCRPPLPVELTPRWRLTHVGAEALSDAELVTLFLGGAGSETATDLLCEIGGLRGLRRATLHELRTLPGVGAARAAALVAAVELGRRLSAIRNSDLPKISSPEDVDTLMRPRLAHLDRENFVVLLLDTKNRLLASPTVSIGTLTASMVHPREVFKPAVRASAANVILVHNHPSGEARPSAEDHAITRRLKEAGELFGISVLDHVIIGNDFCSIKEYGGL